MCCLLNPKIYYYPLISASNSLSFTKKLPSIAAITASISSPHRDSSPLYLILGTGSLATQFTQVTRGDGPCIQTTVTLSCDYGSYILPIKTFSFKHLMYNPGKKNNGQTATYTDFCIGPSRIMR